MIAADEARTVVNAKKRGQYAVSATCPAFIEYIERKHSSMLPNLSANKSPAMVLAAALKLELQIIEGLNNLKVVLFTSCTAVNQELKRAENQYCDCVIYDFELQEMIKDYQKSSLLYSFSAPYD